MKALISLLTVFLTVGTLLAAQASFEYLTAKSDGKTITIEWRTETEAGVARYVVERTSDGSDYAPIKTLDAHGAQTIYRYIDEDALMKGDNDIASRKYTYRIKIVGGDNSLSYSNPINVTHSISGIRRTWGMIKEMFR